MRALGSLLLIYLFTVALPPLQAQEELVRQLAGTPDDMKIKLYNDYADGLDSNNSSQIYFYSQSALSLLNNYPNSDEEARALFNLGRVGLFLQDYDMALNNLSKAYSLSTHAALRYKAALFLAQVYETEEEYPRALENLNRALANAETPLQNFAVYLNLTRIYRLQKNYAQSEDRAKRALAINEAITQFAYVYVEQAKSAYAQGNLSIAQSYWSLALRNALNYSESLAAAEAYYGLAQLGFDRKNYQEAIFQGQKAVLVVNQTENHALLVDILDLLARAYFNAGLAEQAFNTLDLKNETSLAILHEQQDTSNLFFRNSIELTNLRQINLQMQESINSTTRLFYITLVISSGLLIWSFILLQITHRKEAEEKAATQAYKTLIYHISQQTRPLKAHLLTRIAERNFNFGLIIVKFTHQQDIMRLYGKLAFDYFTEESHNALRSFVPSSDYYIDLTRNFAYCFLVSCTQNEFDLIKTSYENELQPLTLSWKGTPVNLPTVITGIFFDEHNAAEIEEKIAEWHLDTFK
jgi:tetratricopeptide (TPR) repeat protein